MKVVIFCGGQGLRMREASEAVPKPMVPIGPRPVLWHVMKYYAHFGFTDFVLCLGYKAEAIKQFFLTYNEAMANDFVLSNGGADVHLLRTDIHDWNITFVDTGLRAPIGERLRAVRHLLADDELFLANYGDTLTDADLPAMIARARDEQAMASFLAVRPNYSFHVVSMAGDGRVRAMRDVMGSDIWINGGYFILRREFLDQLRPGEDLVEEPLQRLLPAGKVLAQRHEGFWAPMDTLKDQQWLETLHEERQRPLAGVGSRPRRAAASSRTRPLDDAAAAPSGRPKASPRSRARDRRPPRRHRDRLRRDDPEADRGVGGLRDPLGGPERRGRARARRRGEAPRRCSTACRTARSWSATSRTASFRTRARGSRTSSRG